MLTNSITTRLPTQLALALTMLGAAGGASAQPASEPPLPPASLTASMAAGPLAKGPEIRGIITARTGNKLQLVTEDGSKTIVTIDEQTQIRSSNGLLGLSRNRLSQAALLNGLPVAVRTVRADNALLASRISFRGGDLKTANMIRTGTAQGFAEQSAATEALRGRVADIDQYNVKNTTSVYFDFDKSVLSDAAKTELCATTQAADAMKNALLLVVGYTDGVGNPDHNQTLSERRAARVVNYLQQACGWKPYRMLTPTGMASADPAASNDTPEGQAQNRRVSVNVLVSKAVDGM